MLSRSSRTSMTASPRAVAIDASRIAPVSLAGCCQQLMTESCVSIDASRKRLRAAQAARQRVLFTFTAVGSADAEPGPWLRWVFTVIWHTKGPRSPGLSASRRCFSAAAAVYSPLDARSTVARARARLAWLDAACGRPTRGRGAKSPRPRRRFTRRTVVAGGRWETGDVAPG